MSTFDIDDNPAIHPEFWAERGRTVRSLTVKTAAYRTSEETGEAYVEVSTEEGTGFIRSTAEVGHVLQPGVPFDLETTNGSTITGIAVHGKYLFQKTNEDLATNHRAMLESMAEERQETLRKNAAEWQEQEDALPDWLRRRMQRFHDAAGEAFKLNGWGYELVICRLAAVWAADGEGAADAFANTVGASGNQFGCAKLLAELHDEGRDDDAVNKVPAGLAPLTGSVDYS